MDEDAISRMEAGNEVGDLAMGLFGDFVEVTAYHDDHLDLSAMIAATKREMDYGTHVICEASFSYNGLYCAVDILKKDGDGWEIYEVKSSIHHDKDVYMADIAYQKYVLEHCGVKLHGVFLICLNNDYVFHGTLEIQKLFQITDVSDAAVQEEKNVEPNLLLAEQLLASPEEPAIDLSVHCQKPYLCGFWEYCSRHLPTPSVFDLYRMPFAKKIAFYQNGLITYPDLLHSAKITNRKQIRQMEHSLSDHGTYLEEENIRHFLKALSFPLYFLDFETIQPVIPTYIGTKPYAQIPFQYSLHYLE